MPAVFCADLSQIVATFGLALDIVGVSLLFWVGLPRTLARSLVSDVDFIVEDAELTREQHRSNEAQVLAENQRRRAPRQVGVVGLSLLIAGFSLQAVAVWL